MPTSTVIIGPSGQTYADPKPNTDENAFQVNNTSEAYYNSVYYLKYKNQVQPIPPRRSGALPYLDLSDFLPQDLTNAITAAGKISFHVVGDTGAAKVSKQQTAAVALADEADVADAMAKDVQSSGDAGPAFFFHLGDVIYNFGEAQYYYDQFYEPFREYDRPIFAIPGNHDGMVFGSSSSAPQVPTLAAFLSNFCAAAPDPSPDAPTIARSVMTQPAVYFTLDAPFVSIIGLYSNVLDTGGGIISSQGGKYPLVDDQLTFLTSELSRLKADRAAGKRAILIAVHHPPLSVDAKTGGSAGLMQDIDSCCKAAGLWPDAVLSGHAHLYQRFTRKVNGRKVPYIVSGSGGYAATPPQEASPPAGTVIGDHTLEITPIVKFGYLTLTTDAKTLTIAFKSAPLGGPVTQLDFVTLNLKTGVITASGNVPQKTSGKPSTAGKNHQAKSAAKRGLRP
jgi:Calcineurin-like phosphoesterase